MYSYFCVFVVFMLCTYSSSGDSGEFSCNFPKYGNPDESRAANRLKSVLKASNLKRLSVKDDVGYKYDMGFCVNALEGKDGAVLQTDTNSGKEVVVGRLAHTDARSGTDWLELTYSGGEQYNSHCGKEERQAVIMMVCNPEEPYGKARILEENNSKFNSCYYLFEVGLNAVCEDPGNTGGLSPGSIVCIVFLSIAAVYLGGGFIYQRLVAGAKGMEQMPNFSFWQDFGNLIADGCDLVFRCGAGASDSRQYRGLGDDQLQTAGMESEDETDEHLLPM